MKISTRLWLPTLGLGFLVAIISITVYVQTQIRVQRADDALSAREQKLVEVVRWQSETSTNIVRMVEALNSDTPALMAALKPDIQAASKNISAIQNSVESSTSDPAEKATLVAVSKARVAYVTARDAAIQLHESGQIDQAQARLASEVKPAAQAYQAKQQEFLSIQLNQGKALRVEMAKDRKGMVGAVAALMAFIVALMAVGTLSQVRSICQPLDELADIARRVGEGDLDVEIPSGRQDELGRVQASLAGMRDALRGIVGQVREASESIQVASAGMATGNADLSQRTEQTANQLQQTASSLQELTVSVRQSADAASQANQLAFSASSVAAKWWPKS